MNELNSTSIFNLHLREIFVISPATGKTTGIATKRNNYVTAQECPTLFDNFLKVIKSEQCKAVTLFQDEVTSQTGKTQQIATKR